MQPSQHLSLSLPGFVYKSVHGKNHPAKMAGWLNGMRDSKKEAPLRVLPFLSRFDRYKDQKILVHEVNHEQDVQIGAVNIVSDPALVVDVGALADSHAVQICEGQGRTLGSFLVSIFGLVLQSHGVNSLHIVIQVVLSAANLNIVLGAGSNLSKVQRSNLVVLHVLAIQLEGIRSTLGRH